MSRSSTVSISLFPLAGFRLAARIALTAVVLAATLVLAGCDDDDDGGMGGMTDPTIAELASNESSLSTLVTALEQSGLDESLSEEGPFTVFAPTNTAFEGIDTQDLLNDDDLLEEVLTYHVVAGQAITAGDIEDGQTVETLDGETLRFSVSDGTVRVNGATVQTADLQASNGVVHVIDGVLLETVTATDRTILTPNLSTAAQALSASGLDEVLRRDGPFTVFAPVDASFQGLELSALTGNPSLLSRILQYHVVSGQAVTSDQITNDTDPETVEGSTLDLQVSNGTVTVNGVPVTTADVQVGNGVIHLIDGVLLQQINAVERATITSDFTILADLVARAGLADALSGPGPDGMDGITVFGPTNDAFLAALDQNDNDEIDDSEVPSNLSDILQYHVLDDVFFASDVPTSETNLQTLEGSDVTVVRSGSDVTVNPNDENASVVQADVDVSNGVIHGIDTVLLPPSMQSSADVTVTIDNIGAESWEVTSVDGASGVAENGTANPTITLTVGTRYRFDNNGGISSHPFGLQNSSDDYLLNQDGSGSLEGDAGINYQEDDNGVTFTYTQTLADAVATYRCTFHPSMEGAVQTSN